MPHIHSIAIFVTDLDRALLFYRDHLGLSLLQQGSFGAEFLAGDKGKTRLGVHPAVHPNSRAMVGRETGITLYVEHLLEYCERLHQRGVTFVTEPTQQGFGIMALVADPDGNILALWEDTIPPSPHGGAEIGG